MKKAVWGGSGNGRELGGGEYAGVWQAVQRQPRIARLHAVPPHPFHFSTVGACAWLGERQRADLYQDKHTPRCQEGAFNLEIM